MMKFGVQALAFYAAIFYGRRQHIFAVSARPFFFLVNKKAPKSATITTQQQISPHFRQ